MTDHPENGYEKGMWYFFQTLNAMHDQVKKVYERRKDEAIRAHV
jgi:hypothetical protein